MAAITQVSELREELAALAHEQWTDWMKYFMGKCEYDPLGFVIISAEYVKALERQVNTPYADLTEAEKDLDRAEADKVLALLVPTEGLPRLIEEIRSIRQRHSTWWDEEIQGMNSKNCG